MHTCVRDYSCIPLSMHMYVVPAAVRWQVDAARRPVQRQCCVRLGPGLLVSPRGSPLLLSASCVKGKGRKMRPQAMGFPPWGHGSRGEGESTLFCGGEAPCFVGEGHLVLWGRGTVGVYHVLVHSLKVCGVASSLKGDRAGRCHRYVCASVCPCVCTCCSASTKQEIAPPPVQNQL